MRNRRYLLALALTTGAIAAGAGVAAAASGSGTTAAAKPTATVPPATSTSSKPTPNRAPNSRHNCPNMGSRTTSGAPDAGPGPSVAY
jgi:hypothetical protein